MKPTLLFDLDGTLCRCSEYYVTCLERFADFQAGRLGCTPEFARNMVNVIDLAATKMTNAFDRERFPRSFMATSAALDVLFGRVISHEIMDESFDIGDAVFHAPYSLYDGAIDVLRQYQRGGWQLGLVTKGDQQVQQRKIDINGLAEFFSPDNTFIVGGKDVGLFNSIIDKLAVDRTMSFMIGDSLRDDIGPARAAGLQTVLVERDASWHYDHDADVQPHHTVTETAHVLNVIGATPCKCRGTGMVSETFYFPNQNDPDNATSMSMTSRPCDCEAGANYASGRAVLVG